MTSAPAISFDYAPSRWPARALASMAALAVPAVLLTGLPWWIKCALVVVVPMAAWLAARRLARVPVKAIGWHSDGGWVLQLALSGNVTVARATFRVAGELIWLRWQVAGHEPIALLLAPDNSNLDLRRRLRMRLALPDKESR